mgnify:CR=1 FL=1
MAYLRRLTRTIHRDWDDIPKARANFEPTKYELTEQGEYNLTHRVEWAELAANGPAGEPLEPYHLYLALKNYGPSPVLLYLNTMANDPNPDYEVNVLPGHWVEYMDLDPWTQPRIRVDPLLYSQRSECEVVQIGYPCWGEEPEWCDMWAVGHYASGGVGTKHHPMVGPWANIVNPIGRVGSWLADVAGTSPADYWAVGYDAEYAPLTGILMHWDGVAWAEYIANEAPPFFGDWGFEINNYWAVGGDCDALGIGLQAEIWSFNGAWALHTAPAQESRLFRHVHGWDPTDVWAVGDDAIIYRFNGAAWLPVTNQAQCNFYGVWGLDGNAAWACGGSAPWWGAPGGVGEIWRWDGLAWAQEILPPDVVTLRGIWGFTIDDIWAVGDLNTILHWDGANWGVVDDPPEIHGIYTFDYRSVFGCWPNGVWAVGLTPTWDNVIIRWDGASWVLDHGPNWDEMDLFGIKGVLAAP